MPKNAPKKTKDPSPPASEPVVSAQEDDEESASNNFVTFALDDELFALPMSRVQEIIRMPDVVRVPLAPPSLEGLANLRGRMLPVVDLRRCCGLAAVAHDEATRVIVVDCGTAVGLIVDRVAAVVAVEASQVEDAADIQSTVDAKLLTSVVRTEGAGAQDMIAVLDVIGMIADDFAMVAKDARELGGGERERKEALEDLAATVELVSFVVDGQEYALPIHQVQEIVQAPEAVSQVPNADERVVGVMDLRGRLLPVVSLRRIFGLSQGNLERTNRIVVVPLEETSDHHQAVVGLLMDTVREVLRVPTDVVDELPSFLAKVGEVTEVDSVCRLDAGQRLVSVLSAERLFARNGLRSAIEAQGEQTATSVEEEDTVETSGGDVEQRVASEDEQLVVFRVDDEEYCVNVDAVQEIIRVPEQLIRVPKALEFVEGLVNLRGTVLPVVDLRTRLGLERSARDERQRILVLIIAGLRTGFIVDSVAEVIKLQGSIVEDAPELSEEQARLISKVANLPALERMLLVIDAEQLLAGAEVAALSEAAA